jgi:transcriptional regulator with XRE-family HTH domain
VLGVSVSTLRRLEADPWTVSGRALYLILRAVNRLGVPWSPDDFFGLTPASESIPVGEPNLASPYEADDPASLYPDTAPRGVPRFEPLGTVGESPAAPAVSGNDGENNPTQDLTTYTRQE